MSALPPGDAAALGFDPKRLDQIGPAMQAYVDDGRVPNLVTLIARQSQIVHLDARGVLSFESGKPATPGSLFRMFSNTKPLAGVATCILYERGLLTPDDPVSRFLPEFGESRVQIPNAPGMTERAQAPHHRARLPDEYHGHPQSRHDAGLLPRSSTPTCSPVSTMASTP